MNSALLYEDLATGETTAATLVYPEQANPQVGRISVLSDVGWTVLGLRAGQAAKVGGLDSRKRHWLRVLEVRFQPEAAAQRML